MLSKAADAMCEGDVVDARIRKHQAWSLLPLQVAVVRVVVEVVIVWCGGGCDFGGGNGEVVAVVWFGVRVS